MTTQLSYQAPSIELQKLNKLWFLITGLTCNLSCKHCYLSCNQTNKTKNHLNLEKIKTALSSIDKKDLDEIYLCGGEPLLHRDINNIIRHCLKFTNVSLLTNGTLINDKKARFLSQIEAGFDYELIFRISLDHYTEAKNDELRGKGSFKKITTGMQNLMNNGFNPIISVVNVWEEDEESLKQGFFKLLSKLNFEYEEMNLKIIPAIKTGEFAKNFSDYEEDSIVTRESIKKCNTHKFDCANSRVVTDDGIYSCPALVNDPRGKVGNSLKDSASKVYLEANTCYSCQQSNQNLFSNNW